MLLCIILGRVLLLRVTHRTSCRAYFLLLAPFIILLIALLMILSLWSEILLLDSLALVRNGANIVKIFQLNIQGSLKENSNCSLEFDRECNNTRHCTVLPPPPLQLRAEMGPYHDWELFNADYREMLKELRIFVYPDVTGNKSSPLARIFHPHPNIMDPKIGNYFSEHAFKLALLQSSLITEHPKEAHFFYMPFSINVMRNHPLVRTESSISQFVANYVGRISSQFPFWNASGGADHFYVCCHSVGRNAASRHFGLSNNAIQITCSSNYFQRLYSAHKDIAFPQVWPQHPHDEVLNPPSERNKLVFFAGRVQNSAIRHELLKLWHNDTSFSIFSGHPSFSYEEGFRTSRYCLHVRGYEVNTARVVDAIHYGCVPVLLSNYYDLPFANILDWSKFSIIVNQRDVAQLKHILTSVSEQVYITLYQNLCIVRKHFRWHAVPADYDTFYMTAYQLWLKRGLQRVIAT